MHTKITILVILLTISNLAFADRCQDTPAKVDNDSMFAEVISRSHLDLELVVVPKLDSYRSRLVKVTGGQGYTPETVPPCDAEQEVEVTWNGSVATHRTMDFDYFSSTYRVCQLNVRKEVIAEYTVCNWETGD